MQTTVSPCRLLTPDQHLYTFQITPNAEIRVEIENLPEAHVLIQYLTMPDWVQLITRLIDNGAEKI
jgi:hypothetical protein